MTCIRCGGALAPVLERLGSLLCHDCRDCDAFASPDETLSPEEPDER